MNLASEAKADQDPVVKSWSLVPTARITSAAFARLFAEFDPVTPIGPQFNG